MIQRYVHEDDLKGIVDNPCFLISVFSFSKVRENVIWHAGNWIAVGDL